MAALVKLKAPANVASASVDGEEFKVIGGIVEVPAKAVAKLAEHGFTETPALAPAPAAVVAPAPLSLKKPVSE